MHSRASDSVTAGPLGGIISVLRPQGVVSKVISGAGRWAVRYAAHDDPGFAVVLDGSCWLAVDGTAPLRLAHGDFVLLPATPGFTMASALGVRPAAGAPTHTGELRHGSKAGRPTMRMLGGYFRFDRANARLVLRALPAVIHIPRGAPGSTRVQQTAALIGDETRASRPGRDAVLERLLEVLLIEALRFRPVAGGRQERGLLAGLAEPALARALHHIHVDVGRRWTVEQLARAAGMSRAVFAERFARMVGMPPVRYLLEWRMALAKDLLRRERPPLAELAERLGYRSASAFSTAFSRATGCAPSEFARESIRTRASQ